MNCFADVLLFSILSSVSCPKLSLLSLKICVPLASSLSSQPTTPPSCSLNRSGTSLSTSGSVLRLVDSIELEPPQVAPRDYIFDPGAYVSTGDVSKDGFELCTCSFVTFSLLHSRTVPGHRYSLFDPLKISPQPPLSENEGPGPGSSAARSTHWVEALGA